MIFLALLFWYFWMISHCYYWIFVRKSIQKRRKDAKRTDRVRAVDLNAWTALALGWAWGRVRERGTCLAYLVHWRQGPRMVVSCFFLEGSPIDVKSKCQGHYWRSNDYVFLSFTEFILDSIGSVCLPIRLWSPGLNFTFLFLLVYFPTI